jgi:hypothetical protein
MLVHVCVYLPNLVKCPNYGRLDRERNGIRIHSYSGSIHMKHSLTSPVLHQILAGILSSPSERDVY